MIDYLRSRKWVISFAIAVMLVTSLPYMLGYQAQGEGWSYTGFVIGVEDGNSYLSKMLSGAGGDWLFRSKHSTLDQNGTLAYLPYLLLGKLAGGQNLHQQLICLYHGFRVVSGLLSIVAAYELISLIIQNTKAKWWALVLATLGGGFGWILVVFNQKGLLGSLPLDFISPESFGFIGLFGFPHLSAARALFLIGLVFFLTRDDGYLAGLAWLIMSFFQPMVGLVAWAVIGAYILAAYLFSKTSLFPIHTSRQFDGKGLFIKAIQAVGLSSPLVIYTAYIFLTDPYFIGWNQQNSFLSPHPVHYLVAYGSVIPFAIAGTIRMMKTRNQAGLLFAAWMVIFPLLIYAPLVSQRRLAEGFWICLVIGMTSLYDGKKIPHIIEAYWCTLFLTTLFLVVGSILSVIAPAKPLFRPIEEIKAYSALGATAPKGAGVLSSFGVGNNLPARVPVRVVMGHGPETVGLAAIRERVDSYFANYERQGECIELFTSLDADYLFWGPEEQNIWAIDPIKLDCAFEIYNQDNYRIFQIR